MDMERCQVQYQVTALRLNWLAKVQLIELLRIIHVQSVNRVCLIC